MKQYAYKYQLQKVNEPAIEQIKVKNSKDVYEYVKNVYQNLTDYQEHFTLLFLNRNNKIIGHEVVSSGGLHSTIVDKRIITKLTLDVLACNVILVHNHPSGNLKESESDVNLTKGIKQCLALFDIQVLDHLILGEDDYMSFMDESISF